MRARLVRALRRRRLVYWRPVRRRCGPRCGSMTPSRTSAASAVSAASARDRASMRWRSDRARRDGKHQTPSARRECDGAPSAARSERRNGMSSLGDVRTELPDALALGLGLPRFLRAASRSLLPRRASSARFLASSALCSSFEGSSSRFSGRASYQGVNSNSAPSRAKTRQVRAAAPIRANTEVTTRTGDTESAMRLPREPAVDGLLCLAEQLEDGPQGEVVDIPSERHLRATSLALSNTCSFFRLKPTRSLAPGFVCVSVDTRATNVFPSAES